MAGDGLAVHEAEWSAEAVAEAVEARRPTVFRGASTPVREWPAFRRWTPEYVAARVPVLDHVRVAERHPFFTHFPAGVGHRELRRRAHEALDGAGPSWRAGYRLENGMPTGRFFGVCDAEGPPYALYSRPLSAWGAEMEADAGGEVADALRGGLGGLGGRKEAGAEVDTLAWVACEGAVSTLHYDAVHNLFAQLRGRKTFWVFSPADARALYFFPALHPQSFKGQVLEETTPAGDASDTDAFPLHGAAQPARVTLEDGDVLYVPPYHPHRVRAEDTSFSLSFWADAAEVSAANAAERVPLPLEGEWEARVMAAALHRFAGLALGPAVGADELPACDLVASRYARWWRRRRVGGLAGGRSPADEPCQPPAYDAAAASLLPGGGWDEKCRSRAAQVAGLLVDGMPEGGARRLKAWDYLEHAAAAAFRPRGVAEFLFSSCLASPGGGQYLARATFSL